MIPLIILTIEDDDDRDYMSDIYTSYNRLMYSQIQQITNDGWATEDIMQSVLIKLIDKISLLRTLTKPKLINYIITASQNTALNYLRSKSTSADLFYEDELNNVADQTANIEERILFNDVIRDFNNAWELLDDRNKRLLRMKYILDKTNDEIAQELKMKPESVRMALTRARKIIKENMERAEMI